MVSFKIAEENNFLRRQVEGSKLEPLPERAGNSTSTSQINVGKCYESRFFNAVDGPVGEMDGRMDRW